MYPIFLTLHNLTRWLVLIIGLWTLYQLTAGWLQRRAWSAADRQRVRWFAQILSLQFVFGAALYVLPGALINGVLSNVDLAAIMKDRILRFFVVEHPLQMLIAVGASHMTSAVTGRARTDRRRFAAGALLTGLTMLLILTAIPWPFLSHGRPLIRLP